MGLFDNPYIAAPKEQWKKIIHSDKAVKLARKIDRESIVLLENNGVLPLNKKKVKSVAVLGPMAHGFMNVSNLPLTAKITIDNTCSMATMSCTNHNTVVLLH